GRGGERSDGNGERAGDHCIERAIGHSTSSGFEATLQSAWSQVRRAVLPVHTDVRHVPGKGYVAHVPHLVSSLRATKSYQLAHRIDGNLRASSVERFRNPSVDNQPKEEMR